MIITEVTCLMETNGIKLTPKDIVTKLNEYIVGQDDANERSCDCFKKSI